LRNQKQIFFFNELPHSSPRCWNIQYQGIEFNLYWEDNFHYISKYKQLFCNFSTDEIQSGLSISLGKHVKKGYSNPLIMIGVFRLLTHIIKLSLPSYTAWKPAKTISKSDYFDQCANEYIEGGSFPILSTISFFYDGKTAIKTEGLSCFSGQEICFTADNMEQEAMMKRLVRIAHDVAVNGAYQSDMEIEGLECDETIVMKISDSDKIIHATSIFH